MKILSLFDGMACGMLAMMAANVEVERYVAYEIDKYAVQTSTHNFPFIEHRGDVFKADFTEFSDFDYLVGGSPCTYWSIAQKNNRETEASGMGWELFSQYVRALWEAHPKFFIYENNKSMSNTIRESITKTFGFEPVCINSALVSAQNRQRLYWVGKRNSRGGYDRVNVEQPLDRGILLRDVLDNVPPNPLASGKSRTVHAHYGRLESQKWYDRVFSDNPNKQQHDYVAEPVAINDDGEAYALTATYYKGPLVENSLSRKQRSMVGEPVRVGSLPRPNGELSTSQAFRVYDTAGKSVNLTAGEGAGGKTGLYAIPVEFDGEKPTKAVSAADGKTYFVYEVADGKITIKGKQYPIKLIDGFYIIRKLTVSECKRLQTVPEWFEFPVSDSQAYKMLGNGWTVEVIAHLIRSIRSAWLRDLLGA